MLLPLVELIAWPGAGRSSVTALLEGAIAVAVTVPLTVWLLLATRRKPPVTSSTDRPPNQFGPPPRSPWVVVVTAALALVPSLVRATPSTTYWAPSTANCQAFGVPHVTYDTYFGKGPAAGSAGAPNYPIDTGLTMGVLPSKKAQAEVGFDFLLPSQDPVFSAGLYHGLGSESLFTNSEGDVVRTGFMAGIFAPDINVGVKGLKKINFTADVQTGNNVLGAGGVGVYFYFTDAVSLLTGPVWFFDKALQPGGRGLLWTFQLDVDVPLGRK